MGIVITCHRRCRRASGIIATMKTTALILSVWLAITAPASAAFLGANSPPGESSLNTGCLRVSADLSRELIGGHEPILTY